MAAVQPSNSDQTNRPWWRDRIASFGYAVKGIKVLLTTQPHARFHLLATVVVLAAGLYLSLSIHSWCLLIIAIGAVWAAEAFNSSIEFLVDLVHPDWHEDAGRVKDLAAGAVLLISLASAVIGILIFGYRLYNLGYIPYFR